MLQNSRALSLTILFGISLANSAHAAFLVPQQIGGELSYSYLVNQVDNGSGSSNHLITAGINGRGYFWQPWFVTTNMKLSLSHSATQNESSNTDSQLITGALGIDVLPLSKFPFSAYYNVSDSQVDTLNNDPLLNIDENQHVTSKSLNLTQGYLGKRYRINLRYGQNESENDLGEIFTQESYSLDHSFRAPYQDLTTKALHSTQDNNYAGDSGENTVITVNHRYYPSSQINVDSLVSDVASKNIFTNTTPGTTQQISTDVEQIMSNISWRSQTLPLRINGGVRLYHTGTQTDSIDTSDSNGLYTNVATSYQFTDRLSSSASASYSDMTNEGIAQQTNAQSAGLQYTGKPRKLGEYDYGWNSALNWSHQDSDDLVTDTATLSLGHRVSRTWSLQRNSKIRASLNQQYSIDQETTTDTSNENISHSGSLGWSLSGTNSRNLIQLSVSDSRSIVGDEYISQTLNFQASRNQVLSRSSSLNGNITYQTSYNYTEGTMDYGFGSSDSATISYQLSRPFALQNINFHSDLRLNHSKPALGDETSEIRWENKLTHHIGMLHSSLSVAIHDYDNIQSRTFMLKISRIF